MTEQVTSDQDETARLILMEGCDSASSLHKELRTFYPYIRLVISYSLWCKYKGVDAHTKATHDFMTGEKF